MIPTPSRVDELLAMLAAVRPQMPQRQEQFARPLKDRTPGYQHLGCVRVTITPDLARQILARTAADPPAAVIGIVHFGGPTTGPEANWRAPHGERKHRIGRVENVVRFARIILSGEWDPNRPSAHYPPGTEPEIGEPLSLTSDGRVDHGAHRLHAVDLVDLPIIDDVLAIH